MLNKVTEQLENRINDLNKIENWTEKIEEIKNIKQNIDSEYNNLNNILISLNEPSIQNNKKYSLDKIINEFNNVSLTKKIKYYHILNNQIAELEQSLFN